MKRFSRVVSVFMILAMMSNVFSYAASSENAVSETYVVSSTIGDLYEMLGNDTFQNVKKFLRKNKTKLLSEGFEGLPIVEVRNPNTKYYFEDVAAEKVKLASSVKIDLGSGYITRVKVDWTEAYNGMVTSESGKFTFEGEMTLPWWISNEGDELALGTVYFMPKMKYTAPAGPVQNINPNPEKSGTELYGFDSFSEFKSNDTAELTMATSIYTTSGGAVTMTPKNPISVDGTTTSYYSVEMNGDLGDKLKDLETIELNLYIPVKGEISYMLCRFYTDDNYYSFHEVAIGDWELNNGWNTIRRTAADFTYYNWADPSATASFDDLTRMEFFVAYDTGMTPSLTLDRMSVNHANKGNILFTFDDAWKDVYQYAYPVLEEKNFKATTWVNKVAVVDPWDDEFMNLEELDYIYDNGWDIGNHTVNHPDVISNLSNNKLVREYLINQDWIESNGWVRGARHVCYPSGQVSERLIYLLREIGVLSGRTTVHGLESPNVNNIYKLKTVAVGRDTDMDFVKQQIDRAAETGSTLIFMFHRVEDVPEPASANYEYGDLAVSTEDFRDLVNYIDGYENKGLLEVETISEWYENYMK